MKETIGMKWDIQSLYSTEEFTVKIETVEKKLDLLLQEGIHKPLDKHLLEEIQFVLMEFEEADDFSYCLYSEDLENQSAAVLLEAVERLKPKTGLLKDALTSKIGEVADDEWSAFRQEQHTKQWLFLDEIRAQSKHLLPEKEEVIKRLSLDGFNGWNHHHALLMSKLRIHTDSFEKPLSIGQAQVQAMFSDVRSVRQQTGRAIMEECEKQADVFASVWNHLAGFRLERYNIRGEKNLLSEMLVQNRMENASLHAMMRVLDMNRDHIKRFFKRKAQMSGLEQLAWYDLHAPSVQAKSQFSFEQAAEFIHKQFSSFSKSLGDFAEHAFSEGWIEAENRSGKRGGGFCASLPVSKQSRIFLTYGETYQDTVILAHELGHAYHNFMLHREPFFAQIKGTSSAETASTFMENLVLDAAIREADDLEEKLALLEFKIMNAVKYIAAVPAVFKMEQAFYEKRKLGWVSADELSEMTLAFNQEVYGEIVSEKNPYQWMTIPHSFNTEIPFYNIPYTIGYLFSNGIYEEYKQKGSQFIPVYDELLGCSGSMTMETMASEYLSADLSKEPFWENAIQPVVRAIDEYMELTEGSFI
ncbi:oligoendopeptidase F [Bacillus mangrovi]|uniref:Oligoendopeptidase F n=1 Tax=Metabacillus mangrovi TaxID=1491830 RepID=A0A7X2S9R7_9BACI|nr:M3 family oligoendopeptidase [Metabacillus mangrovi]MTH55750.1 oligoendopeptidase F [Metabacillus mangrovi]